MILTLAHAMVEALNEHDWDDIDFTAVKNMLPVFDRDVMGESLIVTVVPASCATAGRLDRRRSRKELGIDIGFAKFLDNAETGTAELITFVESVQTFVDEELQHLSGLQYLRSEFDPLYDSVALRDNSLFMSVLAVVYQKN
jgi:hypothetical protein